jgi:hypothetical protein
MATEPQLLGMFVATWGMILPLYYYLGGIKSQLKNCPVCKRAIAEKELREAEEDLY